jgi:isopenicillin-N epimerase
VKELFLLDPSVVYLNHGAYGACPRPVFEAYQRFQRELEREPIEFLSLERSLAERLEEARLSLSAYVGSPAGDLAFFANATSGLNAAVRSLRLRPGDEVLVGDTEYGAMDILWRFVAARTGATVVHAAFEQLEPGPRTRAVFCSHVEWSSGRVNDVSMLCAAAREAGALSIVDGAHAPGQLDLDLSAVGADIYAGNCHKWLSAPKGSGFLYARPETQGWIEPLVVSWDWIDEATFPNRHRWQGTQDLSALLAVPAAIAFQAEHDWPSVRARCHELLARVRDESGLEPLTDRFVQMLALRLPPGVDGAALKRELWERHRIEVPVFELGGGWVMRVSIQAYNDDADVDALLTAVKAASSRSAPRPRG